MRVTRREALKHTAANLALAASVRGLAVGAAGAGPGGKTLDVVFEGGGIKGAALAGAAGVLGGRGFTYRRLIGASAGAITATVLAAGYQPQRLLEILTERTADGRHRFTSFLMPPAKIPPPVYTATTGPKTFKDTLFEATLPMAWELASKGLLKACGVFRAVGERMPKYSPENMQAYVGRGLALISIGAAASDEAFLDWMRERLQEARFDPDITLGRFHETTGPKGIQLSVVATDVTAKKSLVLNHHTAPDVPLVWAVRMSMGIPLVWNEVEWKKPWGTYRGKPMWDDQGAGHRIVDGGVLSNFPLKYLLDDQHRKDTGVLGPFRDEVAARTLGLILDETIEVPGGVSHAEKAKFAEKLPVYQSLSRLVGTMSGAWDQEAIDEVPPGTLLCRIPVKGYDTLDFDMDRARMDALVASGRSAMSATLWKAGLADDEPRPGP